MRRARRISCRVVRARLTEAAQAELACIASPARLAVRARIVTADGDRVVDAELEAELDDLALCHADERRPDSNRRLALGLDAGTSGKIRHPLERLDEFRSAVGISAVVEGVHADEDLVRANDFGEGERVRKEDRVSSRDVRAGNLGVVVLELATLWYRDVGGQ